MAFAPLWAAIVFAGCYHFAGFAITAAIKCLAEDLGEDLVGFFDSPVEGSARMTLSPKVGHAFVLLGILTQCSISYRMSSHATSAAAISEEQWP